MTRFQHLIVRLTAVAAAFALPACLLVPRGHVSPDASPPPPVLRPGMPASGFDRLRAIFEGSTQSTTDVSLADQQDKDLPALIGVAGRFPDDVVALVRTPDGATRSIRRGDIVAGWRLETIAVNDATFARGTDRYVSRLPTAP